ncbi:MAG: hypothetical protein E6I87_00560 [Chloroflexi bacterium]|nr:MAG: hypothetical protein E6I87_00560 [Chloroflexota bacterium]
MTALVMRTALFAALSLANLTLLWSPDVLPNSWFAWTVLREGNVDYDEFTAPPVAVDREAYFFRACGVSTFTGTPRVPRSIGGPPPPGPGDHICSVFPPGAAIMALPFFAPFVIADIGPNQLALLLAIGKVVAALEEGLAAGLLVAALAPFAGRRFALFLGVLYLLATGVHTTSAQALWQHGAVHLLEILALYLLLPLFRRADVSRRRLIVAGLALGFAVVTRQTSALFDAGILAALVFARLPWRPVAVGVAIGALPLPLYDLLAFGSVFEQGYGAKTFGTLPLEGLYGVLLSPSRGLFVYSPFLLFAIPPLVLAWRSRDALAPLLRWLGLATAALVVAYALYAEWWGGRVFGARFLTDALPVLFLSLAIAAPRIRLTRAVFGVAAAWGMLLYGAGGFAYTQTPGGGGVWDTDRNINFDQTALFSWVDPQWLDTLRAAASLDAHGVASIALTLLVLAALAFIERDALLPSRLRS